MERADLVDLDVTGVAHGGVFVARHEGRVVFVSDTLPGERVRAVLTDTAKASFWRADTVEVLDASPDRRPHVWGAADLAVPPADRPGGADFGHIDLARQRALKEDVLADALRRFGRVDLAPRVVSAQSAAGIDGDDPRAEPVDGRGWRTRVSLHVDDEGRIGPFASRSHRVVPVEDLPLATAAIAEAAAEARRAEPGRLDLVEPSDGHVRVIPRADAGGRRSPRRGRSGGAAPVDPAAREIVVERVGDRRFRVDAGGFWQVHRLAAEALGATVRDMLSSAGGVDPEAANLDLYGGVGLFASVIAEAGGPTTRVISVESDPRATEHAGENLAEWTGARAETGRVDRWLEALRAGMTSSLQERLTRATVLLDPPRAGAGREVSAAIAALGPATVVYVACDPVALARDVAAFGDAGYRPVDVRGLDLFPHSHHVEAVAVLRR